jgi:leader peptidase (prepilin peptidase)/N-methyltransferase
MMETALPPAFGVAAAGLAGLLVGSFLNVCIHRLPRGESIVHPPSRCPSCGKAIRWFHNVPVVSWIALGGRCASCRASIPWRYPAVEAFTSAVFAALYAGYGPSLETAFALPFAAAMIVLFFTDFDHQILPDAITLPGFVLGVATAWFNPFLGEPGWGRVWGSVAGAALGSGILWAIGALWQRLRGVEAMGMGDVKLLAVVGAFAGPKGVLFTLFSASILGAAFGILMIPLRGRTLKDTIPFGCFLAPAAVAALLWGGRAVAAYLDLVRPVP